MSTKQKIDLLFPIGRLVSGSCYKPRDQDFDGNPLVVKNGPNAGKPRVDYFLAVAFPKNGTTHWSQTEWGAKIWALGHQVQPIAAQRPDFAWKIEDGDSAIPNRKNKRNCDNPDWVGHWVVKFSGGYAPKVVNANGSAAITEPDAVKTGYFVQVLGNVGPNTGATPGLYMNHVAVALSGYGPEIYSGPDLTNAGFGGALPAGASAVPVTAMVPPAAPAPAPAPAYAPPAAPAPAYVPPAAPAPAYVPPAAPAPAPAPHPAILQVPAPAPAPGPTMLPAANGIPYEAYKAQNWTDDQLRAAGFML